MNSINTIICAGISFLLVGCPQSSVDVELEQARLMQLSRDWSAIVNSGDMEAIIAYWDDDALMLPPGSPIIEGKNEIRAYVESAASMPGFRITWEPERAFVSESGDMAYMIERNEITFRDDMDRPVTTRGKVVTVWRKNAAGEWKNVVDIWNAAPVDGQ